MFVCTSRALFPSIFYVIWFDDILCFLFLSDGRLHRPPVHCYFCSVLFFCCCLMWWMRCHSSWCTTSLWRRCCYHGCLHQNIGHVLFVLTCLKDAGTSRTLLVFLIPPPPCLIDGWMRCFSSMCTTPSWWRCSGWAHWTSSKLTGNRQPNAKSRAITGRLCPRSCTTTSSAARIYARRSSSRYSL